MEKILRVYKEVKMEKIEHPIWKFDKLITPYVIEILWMLTFIFMGIIGSGIILLYGGLEFGLLQTLIILLVNWIFILILRIFFEFMIILYNIAKYIKK